MTAATSPDITGQSPRIFIGHPCHQQECHTPAFYRVTGPHGTMWYCMEHAAKYREIMDALSCSVHVELVTEELEAPAAAPETFEESWVCGHCLARGDLTFAADVSLAEFRRRLREAHQEASASCLALDVYSRLYDRRAKAMVR